MDRAVLLTDVAALAPHEDAWRALAVARGNPHLTPEFFHAWLGNYGEHARPFVPALLDADGRLRGLLPLVVTTDALRQLQFAGGDFWMPLHPVAAPQDEDEVAAAAGRLIGAAHREWRSLTLDHAEAGAAWVERFVAGVRETGPRGLSERRRRHPWLVAELDGGWDAYLAQMRPKSRQELRRMGRRLRDAHAVVLRRTETPEQLREDFATLMRLHAQRRGELGGSTYDLPAMRGTLEDFAGRALERGWLRLLTLELDGEPAGANLWFHVGDRCAGYLLSWDPERASAGLGRTMLVEGLEAAAGEGVREFDLSVGKTDFKARHATAEREAETVWLYPRRTALLLAARRAGRRLLPDAARRALGRRIRGSAGRVELPD